jgi:hypothetical protein
MWHLWERTVLDILVETSEGKRYLGRHMRRWKHNIVKGYREIKWEVVDNCHFAQEGQLAGCCEHGDEPWVSVKFGDLHEYIFKTDSGIWSSLGMIC